jgi:hypothetical protein
VNVKPTKVLHLKITVCSQCPYCREETEKGWGNGTFRCHKVYDDAPNFQCRYRRIGSDAEEYKRRINGDSEALLRSADRDFYKEGIPDWCPLTCAPT